MLGCFHHSAIGNNAVRNIGIPVSVWVNSLKSTPAAFTPSVLLKLLSSSSSIIPRLLYPMVNSPFLPYLVTCDGWSLPPPGNMLLLDAQDTTTQSRLSSHLASHFFLVFFTYHAHCPLLSPWTYFFLSVLTPLVIPSSLLALRYADNSRFISRAWASPSSVELQQCTGHLHFNGKGTSLM